MPKSHLPTDEQIRFATSVLRDNSRPAAHKRAAQLRLAGMAVKHIAKKIRRPISTVHYWLNPVVRDYQKAKSREQHLTLTAASSRGEKKRLREAAIARAIKQRADGLTYAEIARLNGWSVRYAIRMANPETRKRDNERSRRAMAHKRKNSDFAEAQREANRRSAESIRREAGVESAKQRKRSYEEKIPELIRNAHDGLISLVGRVTRTGRGRVGRFKCEVCGQVSKNRILLASILQGYGIQCFCEKYGYDKLRNIFLDDQLNLADPCQFYVYRTSVAGYSKPGISVDHRTRAGRTSSRQIYAKYVKHWALQDRRRAIVLEQAVLRSFAESRQCPEALCGMVGHSEVIKAPCSAIVRVAEGFVQSMQNSTNWARWALQCVPELTDHERHGLEKIARSLA